MTLITSAYDELEAQPTLDEMMKDPTVIPQRIVNSMQRADLESLFFRKAQNNSGVIAFEEAAAQIDTDEGVEEIAEWGEIPVVSPDVFAAPRKVAFAVKSGAAYRVSWEQRTENRIDAAQRAMNDVRRRMLTHGLNSIETTFEKAQIPEIQLATPWGQGGDIVRDITDGITTVQGATVDGEPGKRFDYNPDTILMHPLTQTNALLDESIQKYFIGNMASENPVFKGLTSTVLFGTLQVSLSRLIEPGTIYIFERGTTGFVSDTLPLTATPLLPEGGGDPTLGGDHMSWRSNIVRKRAIGIDNPKAIVKLVGAA